MTTSDENKLARVQAADRVLLLPHCLRRVATCVGKYTRQGLQCQSCNPDCPVNRLRAVAVRLGYKGICIAPGGSLAIKYIQKIRPKAIVAVACRKELKEGIRGVSELASKVQQMIPMVTVPLSKDGCIDTEVDIDLAVEKISLGCAAPTE